MDRYRNALLRFCVFECSLSSFIIHERLSHISNTPPCAPGFNGNNMPKMRSELIKIIVCTAQMQIHCTWSVFLIRKFYNNVCTLCVHFAQTNYPEVEISNSELQQICHGKPLSIFSGAE